MYIKTIIITVLSTIVMSIGAFAQEHTESHSIKIKYSSTIEKEDFSEVCEIITSEFPKFDCSSERNPTYEVENKTQYLKIDVRRKTKVKISFWTSNPSNDNIEKVHELEEKLGGL